MYFPEQNRRIYSSAILKALFCMAVATLAAVEPGLEAQVAVRMLGVTPTRLLTTRLTTSYHSPSGREVYFNQGEFEALSLATADFNGDGYPDLITGYGSVGAGGGRIVVRFANPEAFSPKSAEALSAVREGRFPASFAKEATVIPVNAEPAFVASADLKGNGCYDILFAARGARAFYYLAGDGAGHFDRPRLVNVPGTITALAAGRLRSRGHSDSVLVGCKR